MRDNSDWLNVPKPNLLARGRLFCIPYAGGGTAIFQPWATRLPGWIEVCCIQLPGRERRLVDPPLRQIGRMVDAITQAIARVLDRPFVIFGHSMGGYVAFELVRKLRSTGAPLPALLMPSGAGAPHLPQPHAPVYDLPREEFVDYLRRYAGTPEQVLADQELLDMVLPTLRADFEVTDTYVYEADDPLPCPITAMAGNDDPLVSQEDLTAWHQHTAAEFRSYRMAGKHLYLVPPEEGFFYILGEELERHLC